MSAPTQDTERDDQGPQLKDKRPPLSPIRRRLDGRRAHPGDAADRRAVPGELFNKVFKPTETVYLRTATVGNQLSKQGDVKVRGVIVGEITSIDSDGSGAGRRDGDEPRLPADHPEQHDGDAHPEDAVR